MMREGGRERGREERKRGGEEGGRTSSRQKWPQVATQHNSQPTSPRGWLEKLGVNSRETGN